MKPLITVLFVLLTLSQANAENTSYNYKMQNDDGSYSIIEPYFTSPVGYLSHRSDPTGVCKLYGYDSYVSASLVVKGGLSSKTVIINAQGKFGGYSLYNYHPRNYMIISITCTDEDAETEPSQHYTKKSSNDDRTTTIVDPYFNSAILYLNSMSNPDGVCALYGYSSYVENSLVYGDDLSSPTVIIGSIGTFAGYFLYNSSKSNSMIKSIGCE